MAFRQLPDWQEHQFRILRQYTWLSVLPMVLKPSAGALPPTIKYPAGQDEPATVVTVELIALLKLKVPVAFCQLPDWQGG